MKARHLLLLAPLLFGDGRGGGGVPSGEPLCPSDPVPGARRLIETTCRDVRQRLAGVPGATVRPGPSSFVDPRFGCTRRGCVVELKGSFGALGERPSPDLWLGDYLEEKGWSRTLSHSADGPEGTTYALHQPGALCIVQGTWNHWDEDGESHTDDAYGLTLSCGGAERTAPRPPQ
jgi:hypothetical protein